MDVPAVTMSKTGATSLPRETARVRSAETTGRATATERRDTTPKPRVADRQLEELTKVLDRAQRRAEHHVGISLDERTQEPVIRVTEKNSGRLVREIPPESTRRLAEKLSQIRGLLIDKNA